MVTCAVTLRRSASCLSSPPSIGLIGADSRRGLPFSSMRWLFFSFLALHLLGVVVAYGTSVVTPFLRLQPAPGGSRVAAGMTVVAERLSLPAALSMPLTGAAMVVVAGINPTTQLWL